MRRAPKGSPPSRRPRGPLAALGLGLLLAGAAFAWRDARRPASSAPSPPVPAAPAAPEGPRPAGPAWKVNALADGSLRAESGGIAFVLRAKPGGGAERGDVELVRGAEGAPGGLLGWRLRFGGEEARLERGPIERLPPPGLARLRVRADTSRGTRQGHLRYELGGGSTDLLLRWEGDADPGANGGEGHGANGGEGHGAAVGQPGGEGHGAAGGQPGGRGPGADGGEAIELSVRMRAPRALLFVDEGGLVRDGARAGRAAVLATDGGAIGFGAGLFAHYDSSDEAHAVVRLPARLELGGAAPVFEAFYAKLGAPTRRYAGRVEPASEGVAVVASVGGRDAGAAFSRADGSFALAAPAGPAAVFAGLGGGRAGPAIEAAEAAEGADGARPLAVPLAPLGRLRVRVRDVDTGEFLPSRVVVHAVEGAREPNFGPHFRSGAGSFVDVEGGEFVTPLPAGTYRLLATRGLAYTVDEARVVVGRGDFVEADLELRRVIDPPDWAACDLHVHARPSFDSLVSLEDRVRTLAAAGIDFAVPSEHNHVGDYSVARELGLTDRFAWVPGVEVTTIGPSIGHFNVFPWPERKAPPHRHIQGGDLVRHVHARHPDSLLQINHPRLAKFIGYFDIMGLEREGLAGLSRLARGFDLVEVYNGFDLNARAHVESVMRDWLRLFEAGLPLWATASSDSHSVQYTAAGYPRTYVALGPPAGGGPAPASAPADEAETKGAADALTFGAGPGGENAVARMAPAGDGALDAGLVLEGLRRGRVVITSGPFIELSQAGRGPGERAQVRDGKARFRVRVLAAPWIDATDLEVLAGGKSVLRRSLPSRPTHTGPPSESPEEDRLATLRFDEELEVPAAAPARTLVVVVRGERGVSDVLPYLNFQPFAVTNPLLLEHVPN
ncbi:MAG TPA: CehA/McbA family metallohydrolase [Polyangiaceae bacterium]|nr:CehA/McbA family metallohydrolase [Polyangiaceae bacterium]